MTLNTYLDFVILPILTLSAILVFIRLCIGPTIPDRVIALDLLITIGIGLITVYTIRSDQPIFLDVAMILALIAFLGTVAFSYYIDKRGE